mmetsp:Transcript_7845/g.14233  ORF Transcript_7845/g.14233 Transcript_7845/m.14233 type:complete len:306 (-) Transcript_7845:1962-2879(-)
MEFDDVGARCARNSCGRLDFLPFQCDLCKLQFCQDHRLPTDHPCSSENVNRNKVKVKQSVSHVPVYQICQDASCKRREAVTVECAACKRKFCMAHRNQLDHKCTHKMPLDESNLLTRALLENSHPRKQNETDGCQQDSLIPMDATLSKRLQNAVTVINSASNPAGPSVPDDVKWVLLVHFPLASELPARYVQFSKKYTVGKALDVICDVAGKALTHLRSKAEGPNGRFCFFVVRTHRNVNMLPHMEILSSFGDHILQNLDKIVIELQFPLSDIWMNQFLPPIQHPQQEKHSQNHKPKHRPKCVVS